MSELIRKQDALNALGERPPVWTGSDYELGQRNQYDLDKLHLELVPTAQPEDFEWCHDCKEYDQDKHYCPRWTKVIRRTVEELKAQPERTGHWVEFPNHNAYKCSECGRIIETADGKNNVYKHYPYCHCGAKMVKEGE